MNSTRVVRVVLEDRAVHLLEAKTLSVPIFKELPSSLEIIM